MITNRMKRRIKHQLSAERPTVWVGKDGLSLEIINEIDRQLEQHEVIKAKMLQTALKSEEAKEVASSIATQTKATLIEVRGHTFILHRKKRKAPTK